MNLWKRLGHDQTGFVVSTELILIATGVVIGMLVGLVSVRDQVVQELGDVAAAISDIDESYQYTGVAGHNAIFTAGSDFADRTDNCDAAQEQIVDPACVVYSACINVALEPRGER